VVAITFVVLSLTGFSVMEVREHVRERQSTSADLAHGRLDPRRIAVTYFDATEDTLRPVADALSEDLMRSLATVHTLDVVPGSAVVPFRGNSTPPDSMARELGAGSVISGTLKAEPDGVRLEIRLMGRRQWYGATAPSASCGTGKSCGTVPPCYSRNWLDTS
jgi:TolB-like protein